MAQRVKGSVTKPLVFWPPQDPQVEGENQPLCGDLHVCAQENMLANASVQHAQAHTHFKTHMKEVVIMSAASVFGGPRVKCHSCQHQTLRTRTMPPHSNKRKLFLRALLDIVPSLSREERSADVRLDGRACLDHVPPQLLWCFHHPWHKAVSLWWTCQFL